MLRIGRPAVQSHKRKESVYAEIGLDVQAETIAVAVAEPGGEVRALGIWGGSNRLRAVLATDQDGGQVLTVSSVIDNLSTISLLAFPAAIALRTSISRAAIHDAGRC